MNVSIWPRAARLDLRELEKPTASAFMWRPPGLPARGTCAPTIDERTWSEVRLTLREDRGSLRRCTMRAP